MSDVRDRLRGLDALSAPEQWPEIAGRHPGKAVLVERGVGARLGAAVLAVAVAAGGTIFAVDRLSPQRQTVGSLDTATWASTEIPALGLSFRSPREWFVQPFEEMVGHAGFVGAVVSNVDHTFRHPELGPNRHTSAWDLRNLPDASVVISIERVDAIVVPTEDVDTQLPLDLGQAQQQDAKPRYAPVNWERRWLPFVLAGLHDAVQIAIGPEATERDREVARLIVASIGPLGRESFDGWNVDVLIEYESIGGLEIDLGPIRKAEPNDAVPWIQHDVILRNTGGMPLHFDDTRTTQLLNRPLPELFAADRGCGYARVGDDRIKWHFCLHYLDVFTIDADAVERRDVTLWKDLPGLARLVPGEYVFSKVYRFRVGDSPETREVRVNLVYTIERAS